MRTLGTWASAIAVAALIVGSLPRKAEAAAPGPTRPRFVTSSSIAAVDKGLAWLVRAQRADGSWREGSRYASYTTVMTSLAGLALMAGGSTPEDGPYSRHVKKAMLYVLRVAKDSKTGIIARGSQPMYGHGFSMLFLAQCYGVESNSAYGKQLRTALKRAVDLTVKGISKDGGWTYNPNSGDEGSVTVTQLQALRACKNAGISVPAETIEKAVKYVRACQNPDGGISYSYRSRGSSRPAISAAAIACFYAAGVHDRKAGGSGEEGKAVARLTKYCVGAISPGNSNYHDFYTHFYMSQAMYQKGGENYTSYYPKLRDYLLGKQYTDGSWMGDSVGNTYGTSLACIMLQLPYGYLPVYQR